jgi:hypothetical protein
MAVRKPLFINSDNNLQEMTDAHILLWQRKAIYQYSLNPSAELEVVSNSGANMAAITETRLTSGAAVVSVSANPSASAGAPSVTIDVSYDRIDFQYNTTVGQTEDTDNRAFPIYRNSNNDIQAMTLEDLKDTFLHPAIDLMVAADTSANDPNVAGTYRIHTSTTLKNFTAVSGASASLVIEAGGTDGAGANAGDNLITESDDSHNLSTEPNVLPIFTDTTSTEFAAASIGAATTTQIGVASTVLNYYLMRRNGTDINGLVDGETTFLVIEDFGTDGQGTNAGDNIIDELDSDDILMENEIVSVVHPLSINSDGNIQEYFETEFIFIVNEDDSGEHIIDETDSDDMLMEDEITGFDSLLGNWLRFTAGQSGDGYKITYAIGASVSGTQRGSAITNKQLGSTVTSTLLVGTDDYRAQQFPSGTATVTNTYLFKINKA